MENVLKRFNERDCTAFGDVYSSIYDELTFFASKLYWKTSVSASDAVQDAFLYIWQRKELQFHRMESIKAYLYLIIKNNFRNYITHSKHVERFIEHAESDSDMVVHMIESEVYSLVTQSIKLLPEDCASIFEFHIQGWTAHEISQKLSVSERTVFNKQAKAVEILQKKLKKETFLMLITLTIGV